MAVRDDGKGASMPNETQARSMKRVPPTGAQQRTDGETAGVGSTFSAELRERENKSNTRNKGPNRTMSEIGAESMSVVRMSSRKTGQVG